MTESGHNYTFRGFDGPYWERKAEQARQDAFRAHETEHRSAKAEVIDLAAALEASVAAAKAARERHPTAKAEAAARIVSEAQDGVGRS